MLLRGSSLRLSTQCQTSLRGCSSGTPLQTRPVRFTARAGMCRPMVCCRASLTDGLLYMIKEEGDMQTSATEASHTVSISRPCRSQAGYVMAAAVWPGPEASFDEEQSWWAAGPLSWRIAEEREQWRAEQQMLPTQKPQPGRKAQPAQQAAGEALASVDQEAVDIEQQWLQPPAVLEPPQ